MKKRYLGSVEVSTIGMGCMGFSHAEGAQTDIAAAAKIVREAASTMAELIQEGKVLHWGVSEADEDYLRRANAVCPIAVVENNYNIINRNSTN